MNCLYILQSEDGGYYIGSTTDLRRRLREHLSGSTHTTKRMRSVRLVFSQEYETLTQAQYIERKLKSLKRKDYIEKIIKDGKIKITPP